MAVRRVRRREAGPLATQQSPRTRPPDPGLAFPRAPANPGGAKTRRRVDGPATPERDGHDPSPLQASGSAGELDAGGLQRTGLGTPGPRLAEALGGPGERPTPPTFPTRVSAIIQTSHASPLPGRALPPGPVMGKARCSCLRSTRNRSHSNDPPEAPLHVVSLVQAPGATLRAVPRRSSPFLEEPSQHRRTLAGSPGRLLGGWGDLRTPRTGGGSGWRNLPVPGGRRVRRGGFDRSA